LLTRSLGDATQDSMLKGLVEKSLLRAEPGASGEPRYVMLESIRAYAREKLSARAHAEAARQIHAEHYFQLAQMAKPHLLGGGELLWMNRLEEEHDNLRAALGWATEIPAREEFALALVDALYHFWHVRGYLSESRAWMERALALSAEPTEVRARLLNYAGRIAQMQGDLKTAERYQQEALEMQSYLGDEAGTCRSLETLAIIAGSQGDYAHAGQLMEQALAVRRKLGDKTAMLPPLNNLAIVYRRQHNLTRAEELYRECAALCRELDAQKALSHALHGLAEVRYDLGDYTESFTLLGESVVIRHRLGNRTELSNSFGALGMTRYHLGDPLGAAQLMAASLKLTEELGMAIAPANRAEIDGNITLVRSALGDARFEQAWATGRALSVDAVVQFALSEPAIP
jgi:non-specific serine/threonine protein kinase